MLTANIYQAKAKLSYLVNMALAGKDVFISKAGEPKVKLVAISGKLKKRQPGMLKGKIFISKDFDTLPPDLARAFGME